MKGLLNLCDLCNRLVVGWTKVGHHLHHTRTVWHYTNCRHSCIRQTI